MKGGRYNAGKLWQDIKAALPEVKTMGPDGIFDQAFLKAAGNAAEGAYITFGGVGPILLVEQNALMALNLAGRGYVLETGSSVLHDQAANLRENPRVQRAYLGG